MSKYPGQADRSRLQAFMSDYKSMTYPPFMRDMRVWVDDPNDPDAPYVMTEIKPFDGYISFHAILSDDEQGKGLASAVIKKLTKLADKNGVSVTLEARPFSTLDNKLKESDLIRWYKRNGWVRRPGYLDPTYMIRYPGGGSAPRTAKLSASRVASRHMKAGLLKAPPAMVKEITEWVQAEVSRWLATTDKVRVSEEVREIARKKGGTGRPETKATFYVDLKGWPYLRSFGKATDRVLAKVEGQIERSVAAVAEAEADTRKALKAITSMKEDPVVKEGLSDPFGEAGVGAIDAITAKHPDIDRFTILDVLADVAEGTFEKPRTEISVPLFLRRLFTIPPNARMTPEEVRDLIKKVDRMPSHQVAEAALAVLPEGFVAGTVVVEGSRGPKGVRGEWDGAKNEITIYPSAYLRTVPTPRPPYTGITSEHEYPKLMRSLAKTVNHELQHMTQDIIKVLAGLHEEGGLPSRRFRDLGHTPDGRKRDERGKIMPSGRSIPKNYFLRDVEFYTWLEGEIKDFIDHAKRESLDEVGVWDDARKAWVGASKTLKFKRSKPFELVPDPIGVSVFFRALRENEPLKWRKAVGEFWKATEQPKNSRTASGYDPESWYYDYETGTPLQTVIDRWQKPRPGLNSRGHTFAPQKVYDRSMPVMLTVRELWPLREYTWSRDKSRGGHARIKGKTVNLSGPLKWDALKEDLRINGWDPKEPLQLEIGAEGGVKVGEGNHRLAIARELGIRKIPVWFWFQSGKVTKNQSNDRTPVEISPKAIENVVEEAERKPMTPEEQEKIDALMASIFGRKATMNPKTAARPIRLPTRGTKTLAKKLTHQYGLPKPDHVVSRWAKAQANWTLPYLEKLIETVVNDPTGWGESSPAASVLRQMIKSTGFGNLDPFPVGELWDYLTSHDVDSDEITVLKKVRPPRARKKKVGPTFYEAYRAFEQATGKYIILTGIDLETDHHLAPALLAITKAVSKLPKRAARLWQSEVKKVKLRGRSKGTEDASWDPGGVMSLALGKTHSVPGWRRIIVHELGHALEDKLNLVVTAWSSDPYGQPPYISGYADMNAAEDFAETFLSLETEPSRLRRVAPAKYEDMKSRVASKKEAAPSSVSVRPGFSRLWSALHLSSRFLGENTTLRTQPPRDPYEDSQRFVIEDQETDRISVAESIADAIKGLGASSANGYHVYAAGPPRNKVKVIDPLLWWKGCPSSDANEYGPTFDWSEYAEAEGIDPYHNTEREDAVHLCVPDLKRTREKWLMEPTKMVWLGEFRNGQLQMPQEHLDYLLDDVLQVAESKRDRVLTKVKAASVAKEARSVVAYHGSNVPIRRFDRSKAAMGVFWFSDDKGAVERGEKANRTDWLMTARLDVGSKIAGWDEYDKLGLYELERQFDSVKLDDDWIMFDSSKIKVTKVEKVDRDRRASSSRIAALFTHGGR